MLSTAVLAGLVLSRGFGEQAASPAFSLVEQSSFVWMAATFEKSGKLPTGEGWIGGGDLDLGSRLTAGLSYRYRDGGAWAKSSWWPRVGVILGPARLTLRQDLSTSSRTRILELRLTRPGTLQVEEVLGVGRYSPGAWGVFFQLWLGVGH